METLLWILGVVVVGGIVYFVRKAYKVEDECVCDECLEFSKCDDFPGEFEKRDRFVVSAPKKVRKTVRKVSKKSQ